MKIKHKFTFAFLLFIALLLSAFLYHFGMNSAVLNPKGIIALEERNLMITAILLMLIVVIPVLLLTFFICLRYRATNKLATYRPDWDHSMLAEIIWWGFPCVIILILSVITWKSSHALDPFKPLTSAVKPITIQAVALDWKWLFIYPEQNIATVNYIQFPVNTPINFEITADAPMNSFWIPQLGGQIYAMPGMKTKLHLIADEVGSYRGSSANLSGEGFAGMYFMAKAVTQADFEAWLQSVKQAAAPLGLAEYRQLAAPSEYNPEASYLLKAADLYDQIVMKYMMPPQMQPGDPEAKADDQSQANQKLSD